MNQSRDVEVTGTIRRLLAEGRNGVAERFLRDQIASAPSWIHARIELTKLLIALNRRDDALDAIKDTIQLFPDSVLSWCTLATFHHDSQRFDEARKAFFAAALLEPSSALVCSRLAILFGRLKNVANQSRLLARLIALAPDSPWPRIELAKLWLLDKGLEARVLEQTRRAQLLAPGSGEAAYLFGLASFVQTSYSLAIHHLSRASVSAPENPSVHYQMGHSAFLVADQALAEKSTLAALRLGYSEAKAHFLLARIYRAQSRHNDAAREFTRLEEIDPDAAEKRRIVEWTVTAENFFA
jgi:tetratricopeptide (TPR) repeat protein